MVADSLMDSWCGPGNDSRWPHKSCPAYLTSEFWPFEILSQWQVLSWNPYYLDLSVYVYTGFLYKVDLYEEIGSYRPGSSCSVIWAGLLTWLLIPRCRPNGLDYLVGAWEFYWLASVDSCLINQGPWCVSVFQWHKLHNEDRRAYNWYWFHKPSTSILVAAVTA